MPGKNNGRAPGERSMSAAQAQREYDRLVDNGNNAVHEVVAEREFARADRLAQYYDIN